MRSAAAADPAFFARAAHAVRSAVVAVSLLGGCAAEHRVSITPVGERVENARATRAQPVAGNAVSGPSDALASYVVAGRRYWVRRRPAGYRETGYASWYGGQFNGRPTSSREIFDMNRLTAAHKTLPLPSYVRVTNMKNAKSVVVRVNDRGPFYEGRIIDLSHAAARRLNMVQDGVVPVVVEVLKAPPRPGAYIQVGAYSSPHRAATVAGAVRTHNLKPFVDETHSADRSPVYKVRLGPFAQPELVAVEKRLQAGGFLDYIVLSR